MSARSATRAGRRAAKTLMASRATVYRATGHTAQNETTGAEVPVWEVVYSAVPFRLGGATSADSPTRRQTFGGGLEGQAGLRVGFMPTTTTNLQDGDLIDVTAGEHAGTAWRIIESAGKDQATARRVPLLAVTRPEEWS